MGLDVGSIVGLVFVLAFFGAIAWAEMRSRRRRRRSPGKPGNPDAETGLEG